VTPSTKRCSSIFDLGPLTPKIDSPKFDQKSHITRLVWQIDRRCLRLIGCFRGWPIQWNHVQCCEANPCCYGNDISANFGLFYDKIAHESSGMPHRPDTFGPTIGDDQRGRPLLPRQRHLRQARSLIAYRLVCLFVCLYVRHAHSNRFFFFVSRWNRAISWPSVVHDKSYKTLFFEFRYVAMATKFGLFCKNFKLILLFCFPMESSHFLAFSSP